MAIQSTDQPQTVRIRVTSGVGVCYDGVDYGPRHRDEAFECPYWFAVRLLEGSRARIEHLPPTDPEVAEPAVGRSRRRRSTWP